MKGGHSRMLLQGLVPQAFRPSFCAPDKKQVSLGLSISPYDERDCHNGCYGVLGMMEENESVAPSHQTCHRRDADAPCAAPQGPTHNVRPPSCKRPSACAFSSSASMKNFAPQLGSASQMYSPQIGSEPGMPPRIL